MRAPPKISPTSWPPRPKASRLWLFSKIPLHNTTSIIFHPLASLETQAKTIKRCGQPRGRTPARPWPSSAHLDRPRGSAPGRTCMPCSTRARRAGPPQLATAGQHGRKALGAQVAHLVLAEVHELQAAAWQGEGLGHGPYTVAGSRARSPAPESPISLRRNVRRTSPRVKGTGSRTN